MRRDIVIGLLIPLLTVVILACEKNPARQELARMEVKYDEKEFLRRIDQSDQAVVKLFLAAGMDPDLTRQKRPYSTHACCI